jgi:hypothetical protein
MPGGHALAPASACAPAWPPAPEPMGFGAACPRPGPPRCRARATHGVAWLLPCSLEPCLLWGRDLLRRILLLQCTYRARFKGRSRCLHYASLVCTLNVKMLRADILLVLLRVLFSPTRHGYAIDKRRVAAGASRTVGPVRVSAGGNKHGAGICAPVAGGRPRFVRGYRGWARVRRSHSHTRDSRYSYTLPASEAITHAIARVLLPRLIRLGLRLIIPLMVS